MDCTLHKILAHAEPSVVSVNGVVIARDGYRTRGAASPGSKASRGLAGGGAGAHHTRAAVAAGTSGRHCPRPFPDSAGRRETEEEALIRGLIEQEVTTPEPDEETCRRYYAKNRRLFRSQPIYEAAHILFAARKEDAEGYERARRDAASVLAELKRQPERFGDLARTYSACPSAAQAGNLGQITDWADDT